MTPTTTPTPTPSLVKTSLKWQGCGHHYSWCSLLNYSTKRILFFVLTVVPSTVSRHFRIYGQIITTDIFEILLSKSCAILTRIRNKKILSFKWKVTTIEIEGLCDLVLIQNVSKRANSETSRRAPHWRKGGILSKKYNGLETWKSFGEA